MIPIKINGRNTYDDLVNSKRLRDTPNSMLNNPYGFFKLYRKIRIDMQINREDKLSVEIRLEYQIAGGYIAHADAVMIAEYLHPGNTDLQMK